MNSKPISYQRNGFTPTTLNQCFEFLDVMLGNEDKLFIEQSSENEFIGRVHHTLGRKIRNEWGLWNSNSLLYKYFRGMGIKHPDDMSGIILASYYRHKHNIAIDLNKQIKKYLEYWADKDEV